MTKDSPKISLERISEEALQSDTQQSDLFKRFGRVSGDITGVLLITLAAMILLGYALPALSSGLLDMVTGKLRLWFGWGGLWLAAAFGIPGVYLLRRHSTGSRWMLDFGCGYSLLRLPH